jgi:protein-S-isoprenylcysteine O-methyltransferase Ste14
MRRSSLLARWTVPAVFALAAAATAANSGERLSQALAHPSYREWLLVLYGLLRTGITLAFALFTVARAAPARHSRSVLAFIACVIAMGAIVAFEAPGRGAPNGAVLAGDLLSVGFSVWLLVAVINLGRCFGVLPEARGLVTRGPYRLVRHPVYLGEIGACTGLVIAAPTVANAVLLSAFSVAQAVRMRLEERELANAFPEYARYASQTPRLLPRPAWRRRLVEIPQRRPRPLHPPAS